MAGEQSGAVLASGRWCGPVFSASRSNRAPHFLPADDLQLVFEVDLKNWDEFLSIAKKRGASIIFRKQI